MEIRKFTREHYGEIGWVGLATGIVMIDVFAPKGQTLSETVDRGLSHPLIKYPTVAVIGLITSHLLNLPQHFDMPDPIHSVINAVRR